MSDGNIEVSCEGFAPDALRLREFRGWDELGRLFQFEVQLLHLDHDLEFSRFLGKVLNLKIPVWASLSRAGTTPGAVPEDDFRYFNGLIVNASYAGSRGRYADYRVVVAPRLWVTTLTSNCRIFQKMSVKEILRKVLREHGISGRDLDDSNLGTYEKKEYVVQYRETDFNFISRLMEQEGIYYFFVHGDGYHQLVLADSQNAHSPVPGLEKIPYLPPSQARMTAGESIRYWSIGGKAGSHKFVHDDFDFKQPRAELLSTAQASGTPLQGEIYDYPGEYIYEDDGVAEKAEGDRYARVRLEEIRATETVVRGETSAISLYSGTSFEFDPGAGHFRATDAKKYLIQATRYHVAGADWESGEHAAGGDSWSTEFTALDGARMFRPARLTPKPVISGPQTAIVVGKVGDEIYTDKYGRVKLQFHWDRESPANEQSSCWVRVAQIWAGKTWGGIHLPRVGQEVIVEFMEGDPDQPLVTGRVYNADQMPPYELPDNASQSGIKSRSTKGGGVNDFNEFRFEDKAGEEEVYLHAQKDMKRVVENDDVLEVGNDRKVTVKNNLDETVKSGNHTLTISTGKSVYTAKQSILLEVGQSSVLIDNSGVTIKGANIKIEGTAMIDLKAPMTTVKGDATVTIKGGIVTIN